MKNYKLLLSFFTSIFLFYSCNEDSDYKTNEDLDIYITSDFFQKSVGIISNEITEKSINSKGGNYELTQAELDHYLSVSGYNGSVPPLNTVNSMLNEILVEANNQDGNGNYEPIDNAPLDYKTKDLLISIMDNGSIVDLKANTNFNTVSYHEQQLIMYVNNLYNAWENGIINFDFYDGMQRGNRWLALAALGGIIGYSTAGVPGMIIGGIVGGVFGLITGGK